VAVLVKFAFNWSLLVRMGAVDDVVEPFCLLEVGRVDLILPVLGYLATDRAVGVVVRGGGMRLHVDEVDRASEFGTGRVLEFTCVDNHVGDDAVRNVSVTITQGESARERAFEKVVDSAVLACGLHLHSSALKVFGNDTNQVVVMYRCSTAKRERERKEVVAVRVDNGVPGASSSDAIADVRSEIFHW